MKYYKLYIDILLVSLIVSEILESTKLLAYAKLPFLTLYIKARYNDEIFNKYVYIYTINN